MKSGVSFIKCALVLFTVSLNFISVEQTRAATTCAGCDGYAEAGCGVNTKMTGVQFSAGCCEALCTTSYTNPNPLPEVNCTGLHCFKEATSTCSGTNTDIVPLKGITQSECNLSNPKVKAIKCPAAPGKKYVVQCSYREATAQVCAIESMSPDLNTMLANPVGSSTGTEGSTTAPMQY